MKLAAAHALAERLGGRPPAGDGDDPLASTIDACTYNARVVTLAVGIGLTPGEHTLAVRVTGSTEAVPAEVTAAVVSAFLARAVCEARRLTLLVRVTEGRDAGAVTTGSAASVVSAEFPGAAGDALAGARHALGVFWTLSARALATIESTTLSIAAGNAIGHALLIEGADGVRATRSA